MRHRCEAAPTFVLAGLLLCPVQAYSQAAVGVPVPALPAAAASYLAPRWPPPVPSPAQVLGYELGERFTDHAGVVRYMEALAAASPRVSVRRYGETAEGRPLLQVVVAREDHLARLDELVARNRELTDPATTEARARAMAASAPGVVYFSYGVHGNESSSSEAALWTAWDLARGADEVAGVLDSLVVVLDPAVNPDGRDRYVHWYGQAKGAAPNANPESREHWEPWPGGRFNHYLFDLNRDWAWATQPETRARLATWEYWSAQVHVDFHEMSYTSSYFFFPATPPINPLYPDHILTWGRRFGEANATAFDRHGWAYYTGEGFDLFYPGYGDSWPSLVGAIGMTYEQAGHSRAGLAVKRPDGQVLTLRDRAEHHRTAGEATLRAAAARKTELLLDFARFHRGVDTGLPDILLVPGGDAARVEALVALLHDQGIRVERAGRAFRTGAQPHAGFAPRREFPAGTYHVPARQPRGRLAITLLQPETVLDATFSYDVSAWSLPYAYGVEAHQAERVPEAGWALAKPVAATVADPQRSPAEAAAGAAPRGADSQPEPSAAAPEPRTTAGGGGVAARQERTTAAAGGVVARQEPYGYLLPPGFASWPGVVRYLEAGGRAVVLDEGFALDGRRWPAGTIFLPRLGVQEFSQKVQASGLAERGQAVRSGLTAEGHDLGTEEAYALELPRVAVLTSRGVSPTSFGAHWFFLERTLGLEFDAVPSESLGGVRLKDYDVLVIPDLAGPAEEALPKARLDQLKQWVEAGGTLVALADAARAVAEPLAEMKLRREEEKKEEEKKEEEKEKDLRRALRGREARELERWEEQVPGTVLPVTLDPAHPLAFGAGADGSPDRLYVLHRGAMAFEPAEAFESVGYFGEKLERVSGVISKKNLERLSQASWLALKSVGRGRVILFADDPLFRHFWYSGFQPYTNALLVGPKL